MIKPLKYYSKNGTLTEFNKYTIDTSGVIRNNKGAPISYNKNKDGYNTCRVSVSGEQRFIRVARSISSTFLGPPPSLVHTADHKNKNRDDDTLENIRWLDKTGQTNNQDRPESYKNAFIIVKDGEEKTCKEWVKYLKDEKNPFDCEYTMVMITKYAQKKQFGFSYKEYPNLSDEVWKEIVNSRNTRGYWKISDMNRVKYVTKYAENVLSGEYLVLNNGYPTIGINGKSWSCHIISFMTFFPEEYANKKNREIVLHQDDDPLDFRPHKLRLGTQSDNRKDAYENGKYYGTKSARMKCASYINDVLEKKHDSQSDAAKYLKLKGDTKAGERSIVGGISKALDGTYKTAYGRTWKRVD